MIECCNTCRNKKRLIKFDYSKGGCIHTEYEGYACLALEFEGEVVHMVGNPPETGMCEMYQPMGGVSLEENEVSRDDNKRKGMACLV